MSEQTEIRCPKCNSKHLTSNKKGFSLGKAVVGGVLTGGVGLIAGTMGSNKIKITCLACGKTFKPGDGKVVKILTAEEQKEADNKSDHERQMAKENARVSAVKKEVIEFSKQSLNKAATYYMEQEGCSYSVAEEYVKKVVENKIKEKKNTKYGCLFVLGILSAIILFLYFIF